MGVLRLPLTDGLAENDPVAAIEQFKRAVEYRYGYGTAAPDGSTQGSVYYQIGSGKTWLKIDGTWTEV